MLRSCVKRTKLMAYDVCTFIYIYTEVSSLVYYNIILNFEENCGFNYISSNRTISSAYLKAYHYSQVESSVSIDFYSSKTNGISEGPSKVYFPNRCP